MTGLALDYFRTGKASRPPLITTLFDHAAALNGVSPEELMDDPAGLTRALLEMQQLFQTDVVTVKLARPIQMAAGIDPDSAPTNAPLPFIPAPDVVVTAAAALIDTIMRLAAELMRRVPILAVVPGPVALTGGLSDADAAVAASTLRALVEAACKAGASLLLIDEDGGQASTPHFAQGAAQAVNTARYYAAKVILASDTAVPKILADGLLLPPGVPSPVAGGQRVGVRLTIAQVGAAEANLAAMGDNTGFISIDDAAVAGQPIETLLAAFERLRGLSA